MPLSILKLMDNVVTTLAPSIFDWFFFILAGKENNHKLLDGFENGQYSTKDF